MVEAPGLPAPPQTSPRSLPLESQCDPIASGRVLVVTVQPGPQLRHFDANRGVLLRIVLTAPAKHVKRDRVLLEVLNVTSQSVRNDVSEQAGLPLGANKRPGLEHPLQVLQDAGVIHERYALVTPSLHHATPHGSARVCFDPKLEDTRKCAPTLLC